MAASSNNNVSFETASDNNLSEAQDKVSPCKFPAVLNEELIDSAVGDSFSCAASDPDDNDVVPMVLRSLTLDVLASDLLWSLFMSALISYRRDTVLRPFPPKYSDAKETSTPNADHKDFYKLKAIADDMPPFPVLLGAACDENETSLQISPESAELLLWVMDTKTFSMKSVDQSMFSKIMEKTGQVVNTPGPTHVFEILYSEEINSKFNGRKLIYAYHGSRVENFHSILRNGLRNHMNKNSVFGEGTYLSSELSVCMPFSPTGLGWHRSLLGEKISCIAVCEVICHPDVKCHTKKEGKDGRPTRRRPRDLVGDGIPEKYYIVQNDELIRVKYLLVYANDFNSAGYKRWNVATKPSRSWFSQHKFLVVIISYFLILLAVGFGDMRLLKSFFKKLVL